MKEIDKNMGGREMLGSVPSERGSAPPAPIGFSGSGAAVVRDRGFLSICCARGSVKKPSFGGRDGGSCRKKHR